MLRFDHQTCDWSTVELGHIDWATDVNPDQDLGADDANPKKAKKDKKNKDK